MTPDFDFESVSRPSTDKGKDVGPDTSLLVRLSRWKTTISDEVVPFIVMAIMQGQTVTLPPTAPEGAQELARRINNAARRVDGFPCYNQGNLASVVQQFVSAYGSCAVDLWQLDYGGTTHASVSVASQSDTARLPPKRTSGGRYFGNHLITGTRCITYAAACTSSKYGDDKPAVDDAATLVLAPDAIPTHQCKYLHARDIVSALDVSIVSGPALDDTVWERTEFGHDMMFDLAFPDGVVAGTYVIGPAKN